MILDFGGGFFLRQANSADHQALCMVCLKTGDVGKDASGREDDPALLGLIYAVPYQVLEPELAFVVDGPGGVSGYLFGAVDTLAFNARLAADWYPGLRKRIPDPGPDRSRWRGSDWARYQIHHPDFSVQDALVQYPSHGHIDLLPEARGRGVGRLAMAFLQHRLAASGSTGIHLQVDARNQNALRFYEAIGMEQLRNRELPKDFTYVARHLVPASDFPRGQKTG